MPKEKTVPKFSKEEIMKKHDFEYIREHFYDRPYNLNDVRNDIIQVYNDILDLTQFSAEGKNTVRVTNFFVMETQSKATSIRSKMSPHRALYDDDAMTQIFNRIDTHPRFFNVRHDTEEQFAKQGLTPEFFNQDTSNMNEIQLEAFNNLKENYRIAINKADIQEVHRAFAHIPSYHRVSQFPNHVAQRIYERYVPKQGGVILDSSSGWGNRLMAALSSKYGYKYLGTDPNSEMHPNYRALADTIYETVYKDKGPGEGRKYPEDYFDIRDQGSEFDIPEWHNLSGYTIESKDGVTKLTNDFTNKETILPEGLDVKTYSKNLTEITDSGDTIKYEWIHPTNSGKGINDTGTLNTTGAKLPPIMNTHDEEIFNSGIADLSFTSPPYFFLECYTEDSQKGDLSTGQSAGKGANYLKWIKEFMYPTIINHFNYLKPGGYYTYNLKDLPKDDLFLYSDWLSACLDVGFELIEEPEMILKARRQFGKKEDGSDAIDFRGATERIAILRKPLKPDDMAISSKHPDAIYHIQHNFNYPLMKMCRPEGFESKLPEVIVNYLEEKFKGMRYKTTRNHK